MKRAPPKPVSIPRVPPIRLLVLAFAAVVATFAAVVHYYRREPHPMLVPAPATTEIPAPSVITEP